MQTHRRSRDFVGREGFTLVEMLVSTALVLLIMTLFAQIYSAAVGTLREQEALAKNDQKARQLEITLRSDLDHRSYRQSLVDPWHGGIVPIGPNSNPSPQQRGFFCINEGLPESDTDDWLSFTVLLSDATRQASPERLVGRCPTSGDINSFDMDDGIASNGMTASRAAHVMYFLLDGKLYRRVHLLRDPLRVPVPGGVGSAASLGIELPTQPSTGGITALGNGTLTYTAKPTSSTNWYNTNSHAYSPQHSQMRVLGWTSLDNTPFPFGTTVDPDALPTTPIALPRNRFAYQADNTPPLSPSAGVPGLTALPNPRTGEELLMTGVQRLDIKVWEPSQSRFVDVGHEIAGTPLTAFARGSAKNTSLTQTFDTWHPQVVTTAAPTPANEPYDPYQFPFTSVYTWATGASISSGTIVFPITGRPDVAFRAIQDGAGTTGVTAPSWSASAAGSLIVDGGVTWEPIPNRGLTLMRITIQFYDPGSESLRQVTIDHSFADTVPRPLAAQ